MGNRISSTRLILILGMLALALLGVSCDVDRFSSESTENDAKPSPNRRQKAPFGGIETAEGFGKNDLDFRPSSDPLGLDNRRVRHPFLRLDRNDDSPRPPGRARLETLDQDLFVNRDRDEHVVPGHVPRHKRRRLLQNVREHRREREQNK